MSESLLAGIVSILSTHGRSVGTGFVVAAEGLVATCAHVVRATGADPGAEGTARFYHGEEEQRAEVVAAWWRAADAADVAILRLQTALPAGAGPLPLGPAAGTTGHPVYAFGFPSLGTLEGLWGRGEVLGLVTDTGRSLLQLRSSEITAGFSGGPVWDEETGLVIGMATSIARPDLDGRLVETAFATPAEVLQQVCPDLRLMPAPGRPTSTSGDRQTTERALAMARRSLNILEEQAAAFGKLHIPAHLQIELEEKRREVADLQARLTGLER
jgi:S1-C subfamily serine protease